MRIHKICNGCRFSAAGVCQHKQPRTCKRVEATRSRSDKYGLTIIQLKKLAKKQGNQCAVCSKKGCLALDHDHKTNKARGYVCYSCNSKLTGLDDPDFMRKAMVYFNNPPAAKFYKNTES